MNPTPSPFSWRAGWFCLVGIAVAYAVLLSHRVMTRYDGNVTGLFSISDEYPLPAAARGLNWHVHRGWIGYDGQFFLFLATDPWLRTAELTESFHTAGHAAYRAQRILLPLLAHLLAAGHPALLPWCLLTVNLAALLLACFFFLKIAEQLGADARWVWALAFSPGLMAAELRVLAEALALALMLAAVWALLRERWGWAAAVLWVAAWARETTLVFSGALVVWALVRREYRKTALFLLPAAAYGLWACYIHARLGSWPWAAGLEPNFAPPLVGLVGKFTWVTGRMVEILGAEGKSALFIGLTVGVESLLALGVAWALYLTWRRWREAPCQWQTAGLMAYAVLAVLLSELPWSRVWHTARILDGLVWLPLLIYLQTRDGRHLVPLACSVPASLLMLASAR